MLKSMFDAAIKETFGVATQPEATKPSARDIVTATLIKESLAVATKPEEEHSLTDLAVQALSLEVFGVASPAEPESLGKVSTVIGKVTEQVGLETIGAIAALFMKDVQSGVLTQATAPEPDQPSLISRSLGIGKTIWKNVKARADSKKEKTVQSDAEAAHKKQQEDDLAHAQAMASAHKDSAQSQANGAAAAIVTAQTLSQVATIFERFRGSQESTYSRESDARENVVDGEVKDVK